MDNKQLKVEKKKIDTEKKQLKEEEKKRKKEVKARARELSSKAAELDEDSAKSGVSSFLVTLFIICIWLVILALLIKLDVGGFGSKVFTPILQDVPVLNKILPQDSVTETGEGQSYYGYTSLKDAVTQIQNLEKQMEELQNRDETYTEQIKTLKAEITRLKTFEDNQVEFQKVKLDFYEQVVYAENGPGAEEYRKYYEEMDPTTAEYLYQQVVKQEVSDKEVQDYAAAYSAMKPAQAARIMEAMTDNLNLAAKILKVMDVDSRGKILGAMDPTVAAKITKIMDPDS